MIAHNQRRRQAEQALRSLVEESVNSGISESSILDIKERVESRLSDIENGRPVNKTDR